MKDKNLYIVAGCNGAGKTTASYTILPEIIECNEFVNADEIARGLSPFQPEKVALEAGKIMLNAKKKGYNTTLLFFWLDNVRLAKERVKTRVLEGGHNIPEDIITRRYVRGIKNLFEIYLPIIDRALIFDNLLGKHELIAEKNGDIKIYNHKKFNKLKETNNGN